jgi:hypothetical protein
LSRIVGLKAFSISSKKQVIFRVFYKNQPKLNIFQVNQEKSEFAAVSENKNIYLPTKFTFFNAKTAVN